MPTVIKSATSAVLVVLCYFARSSNAILQPEGSKEAYLNVFAPVEDVTAGLEFTALWKYDDGNGVTKVIQYDKI